MVAGPGVRGVLEPELRASLAGSQIIGVLVTRYITELEPLASLPADRVADLIAPTLQHYLTQPLTSELTAAPASEPDRPPGGKAPPSVRAGVRLTATPGRG